MKTQNKPLRQLAKVAVIGLAMTGAVSAPAAPTTAYTNTIINGNQPWTGPLGMDFTVNQAIDVISLGVFDDQNDQFILGAGLTAELWTRVGNTGTLIDSLVFTQGDSGTQIDGNFFKDFLVPVTLNPGDYTIVARGFGEDDRNGNSGISGGSDTIFNDGDGLITSVGISRYGNPGDLYPGIPDDNGATTPTRYHAGTFIFEAAQSVPAPVPSTLALATMSLFGLGWLRRKFARAE